MKAPGLQKQLLISMIVLIAVPLLFMTVFGNYFYAKGIDEQANEYTAQMLEQVRMNVDASIGTVESVIGYLSVNEHVLSYLRMDSFYAQGRIEAESAARLQMRVYTDGHPGLLSGILIAGENGLYVSNQLYRATRYPLNMDDWYRRAVEAEGACVLLPGPIGRNIRSHRNHAANSIVSVVQAVYDPRDGGLLGVICADMLTAGIGQRIRDITLGKSGYVFIRDGNGSVVYAPVNETVYRIPEEAAGTAVYTIRGERYQVLSTHSDVTGWDTVGVFRMGEPLSSVLTLRKYTILVALFCIFIATLTALSFTGAFALPISRLRLLMGKAEQGDLDVSFDASRYSGEIAQLGGSFNSMMDKIRDLLHLVYLEQQNKREAEIRTLQAQIKPHFLYNTLDTIRWMAEERQAGEIAQLVDALTRLFRISLSRGREIISLRDEVEHVRSYLFIQKVRYEEKLYYEIHIPEPLLEQKVQKLILQPLVENAIYHGIKQKRGGGRILLSAVGEQGALVLQVWDDGAGMSEEACARLNEALQAPVGAEKEHGYGIFNVNDRIRMSHGKDYGLRYRRNEAGGVTVTVRCPMNIRADDMQRE